MKYGSLVNMLYDRRQDPTPEVGMGATPLSWSDRYAATVIAVHSAKLISVREDEAIAPAGAGMRQHSDSQSYTYAPNPLGHVYKVSLRRDGQWKVVGTSGQRVILGVRDHYYDYSF